MAAAHKMDSITTQVLSYSMTIPAVESPQQWGGGTASQGHCRPLELRERGDSHTDLLLSFPQLLSAMVSPDWMTQVRKTVRSGAGREPGSSLFKSCLLHHYEPHLLQTLSHQHASTCSGGTLCGHKAPCESS